MAHARAADHGVTPSGAGGAAHAAAPASPLRLVEAVVTGAPLDDLLRLTADGARTPVAVSLPAHGGTRVWPPEDRDPARDTAIDRYARAVVDGTGAALPAGVSDAVAVRLGPAIVGIVAALGAGPATIGLRPWLDAAAVAAAMATLAHDAAPTDAVDAGRRLLSRLEADPPTEDELLELSRGLGLDLSAGAIAVCAFAPDPLGAVTPVVPDGVLLAEVGAGRWLGLVSGPPAQADAVCAELLRRRSDAGWTAARSTARTRPDELPEAVVEAAVMAELGLAWGPEVGDGPLAETYRLVVGILLRRPAELERLRTLTVAALERYDAVHDTDLLATLQQFLAHHGSTTETAEAMSLHRHTVGYRLARVHEVAGLSPYSSDGRERLSLGLKADRVIAAERVRRARRP